MIAWMLYCGVVSLCSALAARAAEGILRMLRRPTRFVWAGAALLSIVLGATGPIRARFVHGEPASSVDLSSLAIVRTSIQSVERNVSAASLSPYAIVLWSLCSLGIALSFAGAYWRLRGERYGWPVVDLHGQRVRLSPTIGPMVVGLVRPEILLPRWVLERPIQDQRAILAHEESHLAAGDPILLAATCAFVALVPWNPAAWIILGRMRLAIEVDCDARVLRQGMSPLSYSWLLIDVAERASPKSFAATALADRSSHLHQRILAMESRRFTHPLLRAAAVAAIGLAGILAACEARMPTAADIEHIDARSAERGAEALGVITRDTALVWWINGVASSEAVAKSIPTDSIATVNVGKLEGRSYIHVTTKGAKNVGFAERVDTLSATVRRDGHNETVSALRKPLDARSGEAKPLLVIDGVRSDPSALKTLDRARIERVDVLKGELAGKLYGAGATNGVIVITTKSR